VIPKTIHYCWFGGKPLPELAIKCISSWKKHFPSYEIKEWNETNYDVHKISYTSEAYHAKKYAFVSDYARFDILHQYGGIYFDTDVEVIRPFDNILAKGGFMGLESKKTVAAGLGVGCNAGSDIIHQILESYNKLHFLNVDGSYNLKTVVDHVTTVLKKNGLKGKNEIQFLDDLVIYPTEYFSPMLVKTRILNITKNTYSIHHYAGSWLSDEDLKRVELRKQICATFGDTIFSKTIIFFLLVTKRIKTHGLFDTIKFCYKKYRES